MTISQFGPYVQHFVDDLESVADRMRVSLLALGLRVC